jgi:aldehyde:ferredoxin oxidoreductase
LLGLDRKDDYPPQHTFEYPLKVEFQGKKMELMLSKEKFDEVLEKFYKLSGYDEKTGIPTRATLKSLGLVKVARDLEKQGMLNN